MRKKIIVALLRCCLWRVVLWWCSTLRITKVGHEKFESLRTSGKNYVAAFWHGSMLTGWFLNKPAGGSRVSALVSQSKDGEFLSTVLERWNYVMIRGSSHIGGKEAMLLMMEEVENGSSLAITPDGPRGPKREMKMGAVRIAQKAGVPLVLIGIAPKKKKNLKSWDAFEIPLPFSSVIAVYSEPVTIPGNLEGEPLNEFKRMMEVRLNELTWQAETHG